MVGALSFYSADSENKPERIRSIYTARMPQEKACEFKADFLRMLTAVEEKIPLHESVDIKKILLTDGHLIIFYSFLYYRKLYYTYKVKINKT